MWIPDTELNSSVLGLTASSDIPPILLHRSYAKQIGYTRETESNAVGILDGI